MSKRLILLTSLVFMLSLVCNVRVQAADGLLLVEYWNNIGGTTIPDLTDNAAYPDSPDEQGVLTLFDRPYDRPAPNNDNYGARIRGYLHPPETGDYTFWIASDDASNLYLSTNDDPANAVLVAEIGGWCPAYDWDNTAGSDNPNQVSAPITLEGGQTYYVEAIYKEGGGGDGFAAAWQGPGIPDRVVISGDYLSSVALPASLLVSRDPNPADGAIDADTTSLEWVAGPTAVSSKVYLSTDATIEESELVEETAMAILLTTLDPGMTYYWRVDAVDADGTVYEGNLWSFSTLPLEAHFPSPADGARAVESGATLSWTAGKGVIMHDVYFGTDEAAVAAGDPSTFKGKVMVTSYDPGALELFTTYYWKVDEFSVTGTNAGPVWSFSTPEYIVIDSAEATLNYDNTADPFVSELAYEVPADLRYGGVGDLTLRFQGMAASEGSVSLDEATGTYTLTGSGADIWGSSDQFHYAYRELTGDGEIVAQVVDNGTGSNTWAKGGVMIRESLAADSKHMIMALTGGDGGGIAFQGRMETGGSSTSYHGDVTASPPYWVKLTREGNTITAYASADGVTWDLFSDTSPDGGHTNPIDVEMADPVLVGLFVTSHQSGEKRTYTFDNVDIVGDISDVTMNTDIGIPGNAPAPVYVKLEDSSGATAKVTHGNPAATNIETWRDWRISLDKFAGVDATSAAALYVGVGDGQPGGTGSITIDDVFVVKPAGAANIILVTRTTDEDADGIPDDQGLVDWLVAEGHTVDVQRDNWVELDDAKIAALNAADLIIVSRGSASGDYDEEGEPTQWNSIETPMILMNAYLTRTTRWSWLDSTSATQLDFPIMEAVLPDHPIFEGVAVDADNIVLAIDGAVGSGQTTFVTADSVGNGTLIAQSIDGVPWIVEWEAGVEFFDGAGQVPAAPRLMYTNGTQEPPTWGEQNLTEDGLQILRNAIKMLVPAVENDVTKPGDIVKGIPDDGDWPGAEHPALAIDDNTGTKYLHFKGDFNPDPGTGGSGIKITPLDGPTVVTGLTFTTANDAEPRDPIAFELSGSNDSIDGPYELIASGDIVDFAQADAWPRFTKNETAIAFENYAAYSHYQIIFTAIRDAANANSMQIAEVELLGCLAADAPGSPNVKINFQQTGGDVPEGYLPDGGEVFGDRGNRYSYGWNKDIQGDARNRDNPDSPDERYDTTNHLQKGDDAIWEIELPNGTYDLLVACGEVSYTDQINNMDIEGTVVLDPDGEDNFDEYTLTVEVTDGRLTIKPAAGASNAKIMFVDIAQAAAAGFSDDFNRADGELGNDWSTQADGTIEVMIVDNEVLIAGEQATDWARSGLSRNVGDETIISCDFKGDDSFNVHVRIDDVATSAFLEIYTWGGPLIHANSEDGSWPGWTDIVGSEVVGGEYNNLVLEQVGTDFIVTLNGVAVATLTNAGLTDIGSVLFSSDAAAGTVGSIRFDNVVLSGP